MIPIPDIVLQQTQTGAGGIRVPHERHLTGPLRSYGTFFELFEFLH